MIGQSTARRRFLQYLAASPLMAGAADVLAQEQRLPDPSVWGTRTLDKLITSPREAINVFDFEPVMREKVPPAHFGYMATGIDDEVTLRANREGFLKLQLRPRRLIDVETLDLRMELFGQTYPSPIVLAPTASNRAFHEDGELAVARAARKGDHLQVLSTVATVSIEQAMEARGRPVWFQLYPTNKWEVAEGLARRAEKAGAETIVVTADVIAHQNWETLVRLWRTDTRSCGSCHAFGLASYVKHKPNFDGLDISGITSTGATNLTWDFIKRLRDTVKTRLVLKGLMTAEDAVLAIDNGLDGIVVSNHGGRQLDTSLAAIDALPEVVDEVGAELEVFVDGGVRRGTDVLKALALGARAAMIGRPVLWGLGAAGEQGVRDVLEIFHREIALAMTLAGCADCGQVTREHVQRGSAPS
jgi:isopentenyl diphosphate isomerase/L-lactate dehydrogenase-like FMN-dependent dehydrogenase